MRGLKPHLRGGRRVLLPLAPNHTDASLIRLSLKGKTTYRYGLTAKRHLGEGYELSFSGLKASIRAEKPNSSATFRARRAAISDHLLTTGKPGFTDRELRVLNKMIVGRSVATQEEKQARGAITWNLLTVILEELQLRDPRFSLMHRRAIIVCWATGLRTCQMSTVRARMFKQENDGTISLTIPKIHDPKEKSRGGPPKMEDRVVEAHGTEVLRIFLQCRSGHETLLPVGLWKPAQINQWIQLAAQARPDVFDPNLLWDGAHCLRHGVATDVLQSTNDVRAVLKVTGQATTQMGRWYGRSTASRLRRVMSSRRK